MPHLQKVFSFKLYALFALLGSLLLFALLAFFMLARIETAKQTVYQRNQGFANQEMAHAIYVLREKLNAFAEHFCAWDETRQQLQNPVYYSYWRASRVQEIGLPDYLADVELYNGTGKSLRSDSNNLSLPATLPFLENYLYKENGQAYLVYFKTVYRDAEKKNSLLGYVGFKIDLIQALKHLSRFRYIDAEAIRLDIVEGEQVPGDEAEFHIRFELLTLQDSGGLEQLIKQSLFHFGLLIVLISLAYYAIVWFLFGQPLRKLVRYLDVLRDSQETDIDEPAGHQLQPLPIAELETLRESLHHYQQRLNQAYRNLEKNNQNLLKVSEEAQSANRAKSQFLAKMSHELRTPLNAIIGYSELLMEEALDCDKKNAIEELQYIRDAGKHLLDMVNDVLALSKIEAGKMEVLLENFDPKPVIMHAVDLARPLLEKRNNQLLIDYDETLDNMYSDATKLRQNIVNLLSNAAKFSENASIQLCVRCMREGDEDWVNIAVSDQGIGISETRLTHLFEPFVQADSSTTRKYGGSGLGLSITQRFCHMLGGDIYVRSQLGEGSTFTMHLPLRLNNLSGKK